MEKVTLGMILCGLMVLQLFSTMIPDPILQAGGTEAPSRGSPTLSNGGVTPASGNPSTTDFCFYVTYYDPEKDNPYGLVVKVDNEPHLMQVGEWNGSTRNGTYASSNFESGIHNFYFEIKEEGTGKTIKYPSSGYLSFKVYDGYHKPILYNSSINYSGPYVDEVMNFSVWYRDPEGDPIAKGYLKIEGFSTVDIEMTIVGTDFLNGVELRCNWSMAYKRDVYYKFWANDTSGLWNQTGSKSIKFKNRIAELYDPRVINDMDDASNTTFVFTIWYKDLDGDIPRWVDLLYKEDDCTHGTSMEADGWESEWNSKEGIYYYQALHLYTGVYNYYFELQSSEGEEFNVRYPETGYLTMIAGGDYNQPTIYNVTVNPAKGNTTTVFTVQCWYKDPNGDPPQYVRIEDSQLIGNTKMSILGNDYEHGVLCEWKSTISRPGIYGGILWAMDSTGARSVYGLAFPSTITVIGEMGIGSLSNGSADRRVSEPEAIVLFTVFYIDKLEMPPIEGRVIANGKEAGMNWYWEGYWWPDNQNESWGGRHIIFESWMRAGYFTDDESRPVKYHFEITDSQGYEIRYPESGELTLEVFEHLPYINGSSIDPEVGNDLQQYEFKINYTDNEMIPPSSMQLFVDGLSYDMVATKINATYYIGKVKITLTAGIHNYYFKTAISGGAYNYHPMMGELELMIDGHCEFFAPSCYPPKAFTDIELNFSITFIDTSGIPPEYIQIFIDNDVHDMITSGSDYTKGVIFNYRTKLSAGNHTYYFIADNKHGEIRSPEKGHYHKLTVQIPRPPILSEAGVTPGSGSIDTQFKFSVKCIDPHGDGPNYVHVFIDGRSFDMDTLTGQDYINSIYSYSTKLAKGRHTYHFEAKGISGRIAKAPATDAFYIEVSDNSGLSPIPMIALSISGMKVNLSGSGSIDVDGTIESYEWAVDGGSYSGERITVVFMGTGYYVAVLKVMDDDGLSGYASVGFWVFSSEDNPSGIVTDVGASVYVDPSGIWSILLNDTGFTVTFGDMENGVFSAHIKSDSSDPKVVVFEISKDTIELEEDGILNLRIGGKKVEMARSLQEVLTSDGTEPLYWMIETEGEYKVMLYLPDPSDVDLEIGRSERIGDRNGIAIIEGTIIVLVLVIASIAVFVFLRRRGKGRKGISNVGPYKEDGKTELSTWDEGLHDDLAPYFGRILMGRDELKQRYDLVKMETSLRRSRDRGDISGPEFDRYNTLLNRLREE